MLLNQSCTLPIFALVCRELGQASGGGNPGAQESSDLLSAMASSRSSCSCWVSLASRSFSSRSLSRFAHSIMSSSVGYCSNTENTHKSHKRGKERTRAKKYGSEVRHTNPHEVKIFDCSYSHNYKQRDHTMRDFALHKTKTYFI